jgi:hypothetical protein
MANNFKSNPMVIDTVISSKVSAVAGVQVPPGGWCIDEIYWYQPATIADTFQVTLGDGTTPVRIGYCEVANQSQLFKGYGFRIADFQVPTLASGKLYIYYH